MAALAGLALSSAFMVGPATAETRSDELEYTYTDTLFCGDVGIHLEGTGVGHSRTCRVPTLRRSTRR